MGALIDLYAAHGFWIWLALAAAILAAEVGTGSGWLLWPSASAGVTALLTLVTNSVAVEIGAFAGLTIVSTLLARRFWPRRGEAGADINDNVARLVGHAGRAVSAFQGGDGRVLIDGKEWAAELDGGETLAAGAEVEVTGLSGGSRLRVKARR
jgi:membrane protein implicated in regulation of membrane protease activity